jgi:hypothetical protein
MLSACGGSSSSDSNVESTNESTTSTTPVAVDYRVIDGYLSAADVCVIRQGKTNCESIGLTDENGIISVAGDITAGQIIATVIAGQTKDADSVGFVGKTYQMVAEISSDTPNVITPFTTIDVLDDTRTMADIASELNLPESLLSGDYIVSENADKPHVHALARGLAAQLSANKDENDILMLNVKIAAINTYISTELTNANVDLNTVNIFIDGDLVTHNNAIRQLADFLENNGTYVGSINSAFFAMDGVKPATFNNGQVTMNGRTASYEIDGEKLIMTVDGEQETDLFLYASSDLALSVPINDKDLTVISHTEFGDQVDFELINTWNENDFVDQTYYLLFDDAPSMDETPQPTMITFAFSESTVKITEGNESVESPWKIFLGMLKIDMLEANVGDRNLVFAKSISDQNITIIRDLKNGKAPSLLFKEKSLAQAVFDKWQGI